MKHFLYLAVALVGWTMALDIDRRSVAAVVTAPSSPPKHIDADDGAVPPAKRSVGLIGPILSGLTSLAGGSIGGDHSGGSNEGSGGGLMSLIGALFNNGMGVSFSRDGINMNLKPFGSGGGGGNDGFGSSSDMNGNFDRSQQRDSGGMSSSASQSSAANVQSLNSGGIGLNLDLTKIGSNLAQGYRMGKAAGSTGGSILSSLLGLGSATNSLFGGQPQESQPLSPMPPPLLPPGPPPPLHQQNSIFPPPPLHPFPLPPLRMNFEQLPPPPHPHQQQFHDQVARPEEQHQQRQELQQPPPPPPSSSSFHHLPPQDQFGRGAGRPEPLQEQQQQQRESERDSPSSGIGKHQFVQHNGDDERQRHRDHRDNRDDFESHELTSPWSSDDQQKDTATTSRRRRPSKEQKTSNKAKGRGSSSLSVSKESEDDDDVDDVDVDGDGDTELEFGDSSPRTRTGKKSSGHRSSTTTSSSSSSSLSSSTARHLGEERPSSSSLAGSSDIGLDHQDFVVAEVVPSSFPNAILSSIGPMANLPVLAEFRVTDSGINTESSPSPSSKLQDHNDNRHALDFANNNNNNNNNNNGNGNGNSNRNTNEHEKERFRGNTFDMVTSAPDPGLSLGPGLGHGAGDLHQTIHPDQGPDDSRIFSVQTDEGAKATVPFSQPSYVSQVPVGLFQLSYDNFPGRDNVGGDGPHGHGNGNGNGNGAEDQLRSASFHSGFFGMPDGQHRDDMNVHDHPIFNNNNNNHHNNNNDDNFNKNSNINNNHHNDNVQKL